MTREKTTFTLEEDEFIGENYLKYPVKALADKMGRSYTGVMYRINSLGLEIPDEIKALNIAAGRIPKGNVPLNKGKKMSREMYAKCKATMFKKGNVPPNTKHDGFERISKDGYIEIRIRKGKFVLKHRYVWEKANGKIPKGMIIIFKDRNRLNVNLDNLEIISMRENMARNTFVRYTPELRQTIRLVNNLKRAIHEKQN